MAGFHRWNDRSTGRSVLRPPVNLGLLFYPWNQCNPWLTSEKNEGRPRMAQSGRAATKKDLTTDYPDDTDKKSKSASLKIFAEMKDFFL